MPLFQSKSKKAFSKNVAAEMHEGKPQNQALAIAYSVKRKNLKKKAKGGMYAEGGYVNDSAKTEHRPMPEERDQDAKMISRNSGNKPVHNDSWTDRSTEAQAQSNNGRKVLPIKRSKMVPTNAFSTRMYDEEAHLQDSASVNEGSQHQPPKHDDEEGANRQGPSTSALKMKRMAAGGVAIDEDSEEAMERSDEAHLQSMESPSEDEGETEARSLNEMSPNRQGPKVSDMEDEHSTGRKPYAGGGKIGDSEENMDHEMELNPAHDKHSADDSEDQPGDEAIIEHAASIAAAIMAKRDRQPRMDSDSDDDRMSMMAEGGEINEHDDADDIHSEDSIYSDDSSQVDLSRNADEDANEEDQLSYNALRKENYSESDGLDELDSPMDSNEHGDAEESDSENVHDRGLVSSIRRKMKMKSAISR